MEREKFHRGGYMQSTRAWLLNRKRRDHRVKNETREKLYTPGKSHLLVRAHPIDGQVPNYWTFKREVLVGHEGAMTSCSVHDLTPGLQVRPEARPESGPTLCRPQISNSGQRNAP